MNVDPASARNMTAHVDTSVAVPPRRSNIGGSPHGNSFRLDHGASGSGNPANNTRWGEGSASLMLENVIICDTAMRRLYDLVRRVAAGSVSVLLLGETGVGKEVVAEAVHNLSPRAGKPFLRLNCAAFTESLLESELFGHEKGAFSGAAATKPGLLESCNGGTVFLDELGEMPLSLQAKLLRVIESRRVMRVGAVKDRPIDVRFVAATNRDLALEISAGRFRRDLFYRLEGITLKIPPLRQRTNEIEELARLFIAKAAPPGEPAAVLSTAVLRLLQSYSWPGNVRELRNVIERAVLLCSDGVILPEHLFVEALNSEIVPADPVVADHEVVPASVDPTAPAKAGCDADGDADRQRIIDALEQCAGNQTHAARLLGISRGALVVRLETLKLPRPRKPLPGDDDPVCPIGPGNVWELRRSGDCERQSVVNALQQCAGNQTHAARLLGISRGALVARLKAFKLPRPRKPSATH